MARNRTRPRGFIADWQPKPETVEVVRTIQAVLTANREHLPLTLRQVFYQMVSNFGFDKTEKAYQRLCEIATKARRARWIDMDEIRDDGFNELLPWYFATRRMAVAPQYSEDEWLGYVREAAETFELDRQHDQPVKLFLWCEAAGMASQLRNASAEWHVPVLSSGGFDSVTTKHDIARQLSEHDEVEILHLGDHDPSGVHVYYSLDEDLQAFLAAYGGDVTVTRLAVTPEQVAELDLPTAPPKATDRRAFTGLTTQCEAIPPATLAQIVRDAVEARIDMDVLAETREREADIRERLEDRLGDLWS